ncbi:L-rhamnose mutarotase [Salinimicrobium tongyeongense]|uniref:L-rhamnose mutarotase n=1 Tax=Salinimicrobium tongyeongense TaxID=2809707 RepID=A0ABY6NVL7_9FLAO|nr:L-rhamnose mutarotase [Salinimicrobium tongyeongense]UZH56681.1 L-rhamnose mutarotase [Salinimicrobium tongyeongense]
MKRYVLTCELKDDPILKKEYVDHHKKVWPEIVDSIKKSGILHMEIFNLETSLVMIIDTTPEFSFEEKAKMDAKNEKVQRWEELMWKYQKKIPSAQPGQKWVLMNKIFSLPQ